MNFVTLNSNQTSGPNTNTRETKACISDTFSGTKPNKLNNFLFQYCLYFHANLAQFDTDIVKINFTMTYLTGVAQDQFEVGLNQEDQGIIQDWLSNWNLFVNKLYQYFSLLDPIGKAANMLDNLYIKLSDKISTYNMDFICYASQLGWGNSMLCYHYYQGLPNQIQDPISIQKQGKPTSFQDMYALAMTINHCYWEYNHKCHCTRQVEKETFESHSWKQKKASISGPAIAFQNKTNPSLMVLSAKNSFPKSSPFPVLKK